MGEKMIRKSMWKDELGRCSRQESNPLVPRLGRRVFLRGKEMFLEALAKEQNIAQ